MVDQCQCRSRSREYKHSKRWPASSAQTLYSFCQSDQNHQDLVVVVALGVFFFLSKDIAGNAAIEKNKTNIYEALVCLHLKMLTTENVWRQKQSI